MVAGKKISELRKAGRLDEAYELARRELRQDPDDEWVKGALAWVLYDQLKLVRADAARGRLDAASCERIFGEVAQLALPEPGNEVFYKNLFKLMESLGWDVRDALGADGLRAYLGALTRATRVVSDVAWHADAPGAADGLLALPRSVANRLMRAFLAGFRGSEKDLSSLVSWSGEESFALAEDVRRGAVEDVEGAPDALASLPRTPFYVEWVSKARGSLGITAYRRSVAQGYGPPTVSVERSVVRDPQLAGLLAAHEVYEAALSTDGRSILGTPVRCEDEGVRASFVRAFEGTFERVGEFGFVRLPGGTAATGDLLVPKRLVERYQIADLSQVTGTAVAVFHEADEKGAQGRRAEKDAGSWGFVVETIERVVPPRAEDAQRRVRGLARRTPSGATLVEGVLVPRRMAQELGIRPGQEVELVARRSWDKRRRAWGWMARSAAVVG